MFKIQHFYYSLRVSDSLFTSTNLIATLSSLHKTKSGIPDFHYLKFIANFLKNITQTLLPIQKRITAILKLVSFIESQLTSILWIFLCFSYSSIKYFFNS